MKPGIRCRRCHVTAVALAGCACAAALLRRPRRSDVIATTALQTPRRATQPQGADPHTLLLRQSHPCSDVKPQTAVHECLAVLMPGIPWVVKVWLPRDVYGSQQLQLALPRSRTGLPQHLPPLLEVECAGPRAPLNQLPACPRPASCSRGCRCHRPVGLPRRGWGRRLHDVGLTRFITPSTDSQRVCGVPLAGARDTPHDAWPCPASPHPPSKQPRQRYGAPPNSAQASSDHAEAPYSRKPSASPHPARPCRGTATRPTASPAIASERL